MRRGRRVAVVVAIAVAAGAGVLLAAGPALAASEREPRSAEPAEREARGLLESAAHAGGALTYSGTQYVATWRGERTGSTLFEVRHDPEHASTATGQAAPAGTAVLDPRLVALLAETYDLEVVGPGSCTGRSARVIEARRPGGEVAGRFWIDRTSGLLLRREVFDERGERVRSSAFVDLTVTGMAAQVTAGPAVKAAELPDSVSLDALRADGWRVPGLLSGGFRLFDTRLSTPRPGRQMLHLAYSDGLSTVLLFAQPGRLGTAKMDGFAAETVGSRPVWVRHAAPERVVWSGDGRVWTLVSDAPSTNVRAAVGSLPRDAAPSDGLRSRLGRGMGRLAGMLNPFA